MEVILLEKIANLGDLGEKVTIRPGYGRNYLLPKGKAIAATAEKIKEFEARRAELERVSAEKMAAAQTRADAIAKLKIVITQKAGEEGKLFGSVGTQNIADAISSAGVAVEKHEVRLPEGVLRQTGEYQIDLNLHTDVDVTVPVIIEAE